MRFSPAQFFHVFPLWRGWTTRGSAMNSSNAGDCAAAFYGTYCRKLCAETVVSYDNHKAVVFVRSYCPSVALHNVSLFAVLSN